MLFPMTRVQLTLKSGNKKTGKIPVSMTTDNTCPDACSFKGNGCYALGHHAGTHWKKVATRGVNWSTFCNQVAALPEGQLWRHNSAGDLPGENDVLDTVELAALVASNVGRKGFTYTHKPLTRATRAAIAEANLRGFTVNVSCDSLEAVDNLGLSLPTVVVLPMLEKGETEPKRTFTPGGIRVQTCPAQYLDAVSCETCKLCARTDRKFAIGFRAHGFAKRIVTNTIAGKRHLKVVS